MLDPILQTVRRISLVGGPVFLEAQVIERRCVLLRNCALERGREVAEQIRSKTTGYRFAWGTEYFSVGVSIGVAPSGAVNDADSLFRLADAACYAAKNAGRNKVHVVDPRTGLLDTQKIRRISEDSLDERRPGKDKRVSES